MRTKRVILVLFAVSLVVGLVLSQVLWLLFAGKPVAPPTIPRKTQTLGKGSPVVFAVAGDSTTVAQGGDYNQGIAAALARKLAATHTVQFTNVGVSGARAADVRNHQLSQLVTLKPDIVLLAVSANDVTHGTSVGNVRRDIDQVVQELITANCNVKIIVTGSPEMGVVPRIPWPLRIVAGNRTDAMNQMFTQLSQHHQVTFAPIAEKTGPVFARNRSLFAQDKFHPNTKGYELWNQVLLESLDDALKNQPSHCK